MLLEVYSQSHVRSILKKLNLSIYGETYNDFLCLCPFHGNKNTPSFSVSHSKGVYLCFNPSCGASGTVLDLVSMVTESNDFESLRLIQSCKTSAESSFEYELDKILEDKPEFVEFPQSKLDEMHTALLDSKGVEALKYLQSRFIDLDAIQLFRLGYSAKQNMIIVPVHSPQGLPVGLVGRGIAEKTFKNSRNLPRSKTLFNLHRAKTHGGTVVVCESSFDAIRIHSAGFPNVVATLGGYISKDNIENLNRYFNKIIIMTDFDDKQKHVVDNCRKCYPSECKGHNPGRDLGMIIAQSLKNKDVSWAMHSNKEVYPHNAKDAGDMTDAEIAFCVKNARSHVEYVSLEMY